MADTEALCVVLLPSVHHVIKGEKMLKRAGFPIDVIPVPREMSSDCGMAIQFLCRDRDLIEQFLKKEGMAVVGVYKRNKARCSRGWDRA